MGAECPNGHGRQPVVGNITTDGLPATKATDVIAVRLKCGCVVGGEKYKTFQAVIARITAQEAEDVRNARLKAQDAKAAAYKGFVQQESV